jgi:glycosyltransferase involved in cell wall biosynthesis
MNYGMPWFTPCPRVLTLHDAIDQVYYTRRAKGRERWRPSAIRTRLIHWIARHRAHRVITVSEHAKGDIVRFLRVPARRVSVVYEAADPHFHRPVDPREVAACRVKYELRRPYFLFLGGWEQRKNVPFLLRAFAATRLPEVELVLAGGKDEQRAAPSALADELGCADRLRLLGFVPECDLPALYAGAIAFVYPSEYEGFGLQVCEAMAVGCPVLVARVTSLPEVAGTGGETFVLDDPDELTSLLRRVATDERFRANLATRARARSAFFSWEKAASETVGVYRGTLGR